MTRRFDVLLLALCQALFTTSTAIVVTTSALAGLQLAPDPSLATLPFALQFVGVMAATFPASFLMRRIGRRKGFAVGVAFAVAGSSLSAQAILDPDFTLFIIGSVLFGVFGGFAQYYRFAAADVAEPAYRPRAISYVLAGGVVAALIGPELAKASVDLFAPILFAGCYVVIAVLSALTLVALAFVRIPHPPAHERRDHGRPLREIVAQPRFRVAIACAAIGYGVMTLIMTATPLAMLACDHDFRSTAFVIQWHALGMFAPSFVTGSLIQRFGVLRIITAGCVLVLGCVAINLTGVAVAQFWAALLLLGVGWNFMFVGGTELLARTYEPSEKAKVQALNDLTVFTVVALASLSSGALQDAFGWITVNLGVVPPLCLVLALAATLVRRRPEPPLTPAPS